MNNRQVLPTPRFAATAAALLLALAAIPAAAQYKWIGPDGKVNYGDQPPAAIAAPKSLATTPAGGGGASALPWSLQQVAGKYPVTLFTSNDCGPCEPARKHLQARGIPYTEKLLTKQADIDAFKALGFAEPMLPAMTVGNQRTAGFEAGAWSGLLDAAGYPATSALPRGWKAAPAQPMVAVAVAPAPKASEDAPAQDRRRADPRIADSTSMAMPPAPEPGTIRF